MTLFRSLEKGAGRDEYKRGDGTLVAMEQLRIGGFRFGAVRPVRQIQDGLSALTVWGRFGTGGNPGATNTALPAAWGQRRGLSRLEPNSFRIIVLGKWRNAMISKYLATALLTTALMIGAASAQTTANKTNSTTNVDHKEGEWRASKLAGVDVYNGANEKIGDIQEVILDKSGKVARVILAVGGFLGMGEY
jgi:PRC-barrel domain